METFGKYGIEAHLPAFEVGLLFSNASQKDLKRVLDSFVEKEYARGGFVPGMDIVKEQGELEGFPSSMFEHLRKLKLPIEIQKGKLVLLEDFTLCKAGEALSVEQAELLKIFDNKLAEFSVEVVAKYTKKSGKYNELKKI